MTTTEENLTQLDTALTNYYNKLEQKGGTVPTQKNANNLASSLDTIPAGEININYDIPYFDGGEYGVIVYLDSNNEMKKLIGTSSNSLKISGGGNYSSIVATLPDGEVILRAQVLAYSFGSKVFTNFKLDDEFLSSFTSLRNLFGLENKHFTEIGTAFLSNCYNFNQDFYLPSGVTKIGQNFLSNCVRFNKSLTIPSSLTNIGGYFLYGCANFNQELTIPGTLTAIGQAFLYGCNSFTSRLTINTTAHPSDNNSLATSLSTAPMYVSGVTLAGSGASIWKDALPDRTSKPYRKLVLDGDTGGSTN